MADNTSPVAVVTLLPELLGTYGDGGNGAVLVQRLRWRGIPVEHHFVSPGDEVPVTKALYLLGGGEDAAQEAAARELLRTDPLRRALDHGAVVVGICAGLQLLGSTFPGREGPAKGLSLLDLTTEPGTSRAVGEVVSTPTPAALEALPALAADPRLTGFENHGGRTFLGTGVQPFATVESGIGNGKGVDGAVGGAEVDSRVIGTYLHGPVMARNPAFADALLARLLGHDLPPLDVPEVDQLRSERFAAAQRQPRSDADHGGRRS